MAKNPSANEQSKRQTDDFISQARKYEGKSESDLMGELIANYKKGALSDEELERFAKQAGPMLNASQKEKLKIIIERLKN